ncbi:hypothetical protein ACFWD5_32155 [Streptomyces koyangensis]|uniref:hypothetical protein n=1 Tax=Streptomyces koyangensis TaxID=188770 RepID=UPI00364DE366
MTTRCTAARAADRSPCTGPATVTIQDRRGAALTGCELHAAHLVAARPDVQIVALPGAPADTVRVIVAAGAQMRR